ncbi:hypothetical protein HOY80DRAFT_1044404 [Tuber brumale]|nr:hypothetical protein HOY80DRAFT_1044404 [Tuber brumale]
MAENGGSNETDLSYKGGNGGHSESGSRNSSGEGNEKCDRRRRWSTRSRINERKWPKSSIGESVEEGASQ